MNKLIFKLFYLNGIFIVLLIVLIGCAITGKIAEEPRESAKNPEVYFCPKNDCGKILELQIKSANLSVHCALYDLDLKNIISVLANKSKAIDVKLVMDSSNHQEQVKGNVKLDDNKQLMHNKFCVVDKRIVITGSFNPTNNDNYKNNNNMVIIYSKILAGNYEEEFNELWKGDFGKGSNVRYPIAYINNIKIENYFCPEDDCASKVISLIENSKKSIYFMTFSFTNEGIADALVKKENIDIKGIFDSSQASSQYSQFKRLQEFKLNVKKDTNKYKMHHKVFIIDNETVVTGSFNPTLSADTKNDENLLITHDKKIASYFLKEFDSLW